MAEIEMEVDMTRSHGLDGHADEDLIDFDTDMADEHDPLSSHTGNPEQPVQANTEQEDIILDVEHTEAYLENEDDAVMSEEVDPNDVEETMEDVDNMDGGGNETNQSTEHNHHEVEDYDHIPAQQSQEDAEYVDISEEVDENAHDVHGSLDAEVTSKATKEDHESDHEIDYELGEHPENSEQHDLHEQVDLGAENDPTLPNPEVVDASLVKDGPPESLVEEVTVDPETAHNGHDDHDDHQNLAEEEELTYHDEQDKELEETSQAEDVVPVGSAESTASVEPNAHDTEDGDVGGDDGSFHGELEDRDATQNEGPETVEFDDYDVSADVTGDQEDSKDPVGSEHDPLVAGQNSVAASDGEFPSITVQYKGDEFPLFSHTSDGFFTDTSILDETMDKLLSGLREELSSEICHEDELVFQVDELGLEFAESSWRDSLSSVTLHQILEIFDLLVKNQDPDSSRTLYTYLFTKPCASKRLESLIESATAGKGLDEVIHLFESPIQAVASVLDTNTVDEGPNEPLDEYDSPPDEVEETDERKSASEAQYPAETGDPVDLDVSALDDHQDDNQDDNQEDESNDQDATDGGHTGSNGAETDHEDGTPTQEEEDEEASDILAEEEQGETHDDDESESNPFIHLELDDEAAEAEELDLEAGVDTEEQNDGDQDETNVGTTNTSTTTTLKDDDNDDETSSIIVDINVDVTAVELDEQAEVSNEDDLGEIDWRDQPDAEDEVASPPSVAGKRARGDDDEFDTGDEQDVKRRRP